MAEREVHGAHGASFKNEKHRKQWLSSLGEVLKAFGAKRVDAITSADIFAALNPTWLKRPETSRRVLQRVRVVLDWCKAQGFCSGDNPTQGITKVLPKHRAGKAHHAALPYQQVPAFVHGLREADAGEAVKLAFEFTILCASRTSETRNATWAEVDLNAKTWTILAARMKAGADHRVPLSPRCVKLLERAKAVSDGGPYVFPGRSKAKPLSNMVFLMALRRMKRPDLTAHGFRSSSRDWAAERTNFPRAVCESALAHILTADSAATRPQGRLVHRAPATLRPHSAYLESGGPISATRVTWMAGHTAALSEPLLITLDGTILDGHVRWQVAIKQQRLSLPCLEYDVTEEEALQTVIARHSRTDGLNAFCRIALALRLEPHFTAAIQRRRSPARQTERSSTLTMADRLDVRRDIAGAAGVSTGNVTKVKQILKSAIPEVRASLQRGELRIHRAWGWPLTTGSAT